MINGRKTDNFSMRMFLKTIENIVGSNGLKSILNYAHLQKYIDNFPPDNEELIIPIEDLKKLLFSLYELFGHKGAHGLQLRVGREIFRIGIEKRPRIAKTLRAAARILPENKRMYLALKKLAEYDWKAFSSHLKEPSFEIQEKEDCFLIIDKDRYESEGIKSDTPVCGVYIGAAEAIVEWITGHSHEVEEIECRALGHSADIFKIVKASK
jgi:predicted hydrocarbon binding protein